MHCIVFESSREQDERHEGLDELDLWGGIELQVLKRGDVIWVVTRLAHERPVPALCGRLCVESALRHSSDHPNFQPLRADCGMRVVAASSRSIRCDPFRCEVIASWKVWRSPFRGIGFLNADQGAALEDAWAENRHTGG
ncbi:MAG: hypothetical protein KF691_12545 [Phycisphaeraceae bacterium]|nr:hypothetical protein [Phycisphaeraceae bacterium]